MRCGIRALLFFAVALPLACSDDPTTSTISSAPPMFSANPESSGATLTRWEMGTIDFRVFDIEQQLYAVYSSGSSLPACGGTPVYSANVLNVLRHHDDEGSGMLRAMMKAPEVYISVWRTGAGSTDAWPCGPFVVGTGHWISNANDFLGPSPDRQNVMILGATAAGTLYDSSGQAYHYTGVSRWVFHPEGDYHETLSINLHPVGN